MFRVILLVVNKICFFWIPVYAVIAAVKSNEGILNLRQCDHFNMFKDGTPLSGE